MTKTEFDGCTLYCGNCLEVLPLLGPSSVDLTLADPPYGLTAADWDFALPWPQIWGQLKKISREPGAQLFFASGKFFPFLLNSNPDNFKYFLTWVKNIKTGFLSAKFRPLTAKEEILVFSFGKTKYNTPDLKPCKVISVRSRSGVYYNAKDRTEKKSTQGYPTDVLNFDVVVNTKKHHPSQKPVALLERLIKMYSSSGDTVLDFTMGAGSTGVACVRTGRKFIGVELDAKYFDVARRRIEAETKQLKFDF